MANHHQRSHRAVCNVCNSPIVGIRYKCMNCATFDICHECEKDHDFWGSVSSSSQIQIDDVFGAHDPGSHTLLKCWHPLHPDFSRDRLFFVEPFVRKPDRTESDSDQRGATEDLTLHGRALCSLCGTAIVGRRYSCLFCQFGLCGTCEGKLGHLSILNHARIRRDRSAIPSDHDAEAMLDRAHVLMKTPRKMVFKTDPPQCEAFRLYLERDETKESDVVRQQSEPEDEGEGMTRTDQKKSRFWIRKMRLWDIPEVMAIEKNSFALPWQEAMFRKYVDSMDKLRGSCYAHVLQIEDKIAGYVILHVRDYRPEEWEELRKRGLIDYDPREEERKPIFVSGLNGAVSPEFRRQGVAKALMAHNVRLCKKIGCLQFTLRVAARNYPAQQLYAATGFTVGSWLENYFREDDVFEEVVSDEPNEENEVGVVLKGDSESEIVVRRTHRRDREFRLGDAAGPGLQMTLDLVEKRVVEEEGLGVCEPNLNPQRTEDLAQTFTEVWDDLMSGSAPEEDVVRTSESNHPDQDAPFDFGRDDV